MTKISCMVVDDQIESIDLIVTHIKNSPLLSLLYSTTNPIDALAFLDVEKIDCIFLDIEMPQLSGLEFIETIKSKFGKLAPRIILITGYNQYALSGYDYGVFDYLLKPISFKRFKLSADRLVETLKDTVQPREFFFADVDNQKIKINFNEIVYIEGAGNYIYIVTKNKKMVCYKTMTSIQELLPESTFVRVHKSFIISLLSIQSIRGNEFILAGDNFQKSIPIGGTYKETVLRTLKIME